MVIAYLANIYGEKGETDEDQQAQQEMKDKMEKLMRDHRPETGVLVVPIHSGWHWTCMNLVYNEEIVTEVKYYDSLGQEHDLCKTSAQKILNVLEPLQEVPNRLNKDFQPPGSNLCVFC